MPGMMGMGMGVQQPPEEEEEEEPEQQADAEVGKKTHKHQRLLTPQIGLIILYSYLRNI